MRLINTETLQLTEFPARPPPYAILSHTWLHDEVSFQDFLDEGRRETRDGFRKIRLTCRQAQRDGLAWAWVDTCCIDKSSSAELSEAINSMFKWYRAARVCYTYMADVPPAAVATDQQPQSTRQAAEETISRLRQSRWFRRGWTLQELIAPERVVFYDAEWGEIGDKSSLSDEINEVTDIDVHILHGGELGEVSVARRMSWAAGRETTREEDQAYSLMGIFDVNMPMLYGEGPKAFIRLQEEIYRETEDHSIFAWVADGTSAKWAPFRGVFASSPAEFVDSGEFESFQDVVSPLEGATTSVTARGVRLMARTESQPGHATAVGHTCLAILNCRKRNDLHRVLAIEIVSQGGDRYLRNQPAELIYVPSDLAENTTAVYIAGATRRTYLQPVPHLERQNSVYISSLPLDIKVHSAHPNSVRYSRELRVLELGRWRLAKAVVVFTCQLPEKERGFLCLLVQISQLQRTNAEFPARYTLKCCSRDWEISKEVSSFLADTDNIPIGAKKAISLAGNEYSVNIGRRKIQGFDMFCVNMHSKKLPLRDKRPVRFDPMGDVMMTGADSTPIVQRQQLQHEPRARRMLESTSLMEHSGDSESGERERHESLTGSSNAT